MSFDKKLTNCSPYLIALQYINNLETKRSYKREINLKNLKIFKKIYRAVQELFANLLKKTELFTQSLTRALR